MAVKSKKKKMVLKAASVVDIGCSNCKFPTLSSFFNRSSKKPRLYSSTYGHGHSSSTTVSSSSNIPSTTHWFSDNTSSSSSATPSAAVAVEKDSDDPYLDFRQSMLQMILENEIYSKDDLRELLNCFLSLNEPYHHSIIIRAFSEIWEGVFSAAVKRRGSVQESPLRLTTIFFPTHYLSKFSLKQIHGWIYKRVRFETFQNNVEVGLNYMALAATAKE
ncbi:hypothetical protein Bca4012_035602 [Brassica carinata]